MELVLERIEKRVGAQTHLYPFDLRLMPRAVTILLGATQAGKTSLMRLMAGLDAPSKGRLLADGEDVTGRPVRKRNVSMVYQQFINYPSMTVAGNIGSPLRLRGEQNVAARVAELASRLHIEGFLDRLPSELSGGQQQRVALARALAKQAPLMLLDEPLVNLDYKLREELRDELSQLFATGDSTVVYATTEPTEALLLGGHTAVLDAGELLQYGPTAEVFHRPRSIRVARAFSDPPMNLLAGTDAMLGVHLSADLELHVPLLHGAGARSAADAGARTDSRTSVDASDPTSARDPAGARGDRQLTIGIRAAALHVDRRPGDVAVPAKVELAEISGSDTFVHVATPVGGLVAQLPGVHAFGLGEAITLYLNPAQVYVFDGNGDLLVAPAQAGGEHASFGPGRTIHTR